MIQFDTFRKGDRKIEKMAPYLARQAKTGRPGVAAIGWAQEFQWVASCTTTPAHGGGAPHFGWSRAERRVTCYYFYVYGLWSSCVSTIPVQRQLSNEILTDKTPAVKPKSFILWFPEALLSIHFPYCEVPLPLPGVSLPSLWMFITSSNVEMNIQRRRKKTPGLLEAEPFAIWKMN